MDSAKRERVIELGAQITGLRADIASLQSKVMEAEAELEQLFFDTTPSPNPATNGSASVAAPPPAHPSIQAEPPTEARRAPLVPELVLPPVIGNLADQALAILKANSDRQLSGDVITDCMNRMPGRTARANPDSVNAALSRLTTDGLILRVERGLYKAKPAMNTS
jgi:hypothetical protein